MKLSPVTLIAVLLASTPVAAQSDLRWSQPLDVIVVQKQTLAFELPSPSLWIGTQRPDYLPPMTWREVDVKPWGVPANAVAVSLNCAIVSTPRLIPLPKVNPNGTINEPPTYGLKIDFAAADDETATCHGYQDQPYAVKVSLGLGGATRLPFSMTVPLSNGRFKHCYGQNFPASIPLPTDGGPTLSYSCQPVAAYVPKP